MKEWSCVAEAPFYLIRILNILKLLKLHTVSGLYML